MTKIKTNIFKIILIVLGLVLTSSFFYSSSLVVGADEVDDEFIFETEFKDDVTYSRMDIQIDVKEDSSMTITYDFDVCANVPYISEFFFYYPYKGVMYKDSNNDGVKETVEYIAKVTNYYLVKGQEGNESLEFYVDEISDHVTFGVYNSNYYEMGEVRSYKVSFDYDMTFEYENGFDEIYLNLLSETSIDIDNVSFKINLPKSFDEKEFVPYFYCGEIGSTTTYADFDIQGKTIYSKSPISLGAGNALTYRHLLADDYFVEVENDKIFLKIMIGCVALLGIIGLIFKFVCKKEHIIVPVEIEMPEMLPHQAELYYSDVVSKKSFGATIIYLANKGYLKIETEGKEFTPVKIVKLKDLPNNFHEKTKVLFNKLFHDRSEIAFDELDMGDYEDLRSFKMSCQRAYAKSSYTKKSTSNVVFSGIIDCMLLIAPVLLFLFQSVYLLGFVSEMVSPLVLLTVGLCVITRTKQTMHTKALKIVFYIIIAVLFGFVSLTCLLEFKLFEGYIVYLICTAVATIISSIPVYKKMNYDAIKNVQVVRGVARYIQMVEKDKLKMLVMENPKVYYDILPYAYVLGISDVWIRKFEGFVIEPPEWWTAPTFDVICLAYICRGLDTKLTTFVNESRATKMSNSSGGSGGFSGGGFSGGGGGGASFGGR